MRATEEPDPSIELASSRWDYKWDYDDVDNVDFSGEYDKLQSNSRVVKRGDEDGDSNGMNWPQKRWERRKPKRWGNQSDKAAPATEEAKQSNRHDTEFRDQHYDLTEESDFTLITQVEKVEATVSTAPRSGVEIDCKVILEHSRNINSALKHSSNNDEKNAGDSPTTIEYGLDEDEGKAVSYTLI